jgi:uncharacterized protein (DUF305 family)
MPSHLVPRIGALLLAGALILASFPLVRAQGTGGPPMGMSPDAVAQHYIQEMIPHHEDAITMADLALAQSEHPELRELATAIKRVQTEEIEFMRQWYRDWYGSEVPASTMAQMGHGMSGHEATAIDGAVPFDRAFIEEMIPHHQVAVMMSTMALRHVDRPELRELLQSIIASQSAEIARMQGWYEAWYGTSVPNAGGPHGPGTAAGSGAGMHPGHGPMMGPGQGQGMGPGPHAGMGHGPRHQAFHD